MKKICCFICLLILPIALFLGGCGTADISLTTHYPENYKIVARASIGTIYSEQTFAVLNGVYYYKYQGYTDNFAATSDIMVQYIGIKSGNSFECYDYDAINGWYESSVIFNNCWAYLDTYCSAPNILFKASDKQSDSVVNGVACYTYVINGVTYKISKDEYHIEYYFSVNTGSALVYEVQSFTTSNCFSGVPTKNMPSAS